MVLAHTDPVHVRRLLGALAPLPIFLHCDRSTPAAVFDAMTADLPDGCTVLPRLATGWAKWENVAAEISGYRSALRTTAATHIALLTGSDYPLAPTAAVLNFLAANRGRSFVTYHPFPYAGWGRSGGTSRLRYRHWAYRKHMLRLPVPRPLPRGIVLAGGSQMKVLARAHAQAVVDVAAAHPELLEFWRRSWVADETFVASVLSTPAFAPGWADEHVEGSLWSIGWDGSKQKSPPWLGMADLDRLVSAREQTEGLPALFARKFSTSFDTAVLDAIDRRLRGETPGGVG